MKNFSIFLLFLSCVDVFGYKHHLINNSMYNWHIVYKVAAAKTDLSRFAVFQDIGLYYSPRGSYSSLGGTAVKGVTFEVWVAPYSIIHVDNYVAGSEYDTSGYVWRSIEAKNMWGTKKDLKKGKSGADSIYWIIEDDVKKGGGNIRSHGWAQKGIGGGSGSWENYKKKHQDEMGKKYKKFEDDMYFLGGNYVHNVRSRESRATFQMASLPNISVMTNVWQVSEQAKKKHTTQEKQQEANQCNKLRNAKLKPEDIEKINEDIKKVQDDIAFYKDKSTKPGGLLITEVDTLRAREKELGNLNKKLKDEEQRAQDYKKSGCKEVLGKEY